jgi:predicted enzyme related to lactoylglutathione lyase
MTQPITRLPAGASLEQLRKQAKERLSDLRADNPGAKLADAQLDIARSYGFESWPRLVHHVESLLDGAGPRILAPVSRSLGARDPAVTAAFWRDILGFTVRETADPDVLELSSGPALVCLGAEDHAASPLVFFQVSDVTAMHDQVRERGGSPSAIEKMNHLKLRLFEIRDPDGHVLWFGDTYQESTRPRREVLFEKALPELPLNDVAAGVRHYVEVLGFAINYAQADIGVMERDAVTVLLIQRTEAHRGIGSAYFYVRDVDALHAELVARGANVRGEPISRPWGLREMDVLDLEGNRLRFGQTFE